MDNMMHDDYWGMGSGYWMITIIIILAVVLLFRNRRGKN